MDVKKVAMWTVGIFVAVILMGTLLNSCAGPSNANAMNGQNGATGNYGGGPGYQDNSNHGWLWGTLAGAAAGYGLAKYFNRNKTQTPAQSPQQKSLTPKPRPKAPENKVTPPGTGRPQAPSYKPSAPSNSYKPSAPTKKR